MSGCIVRWKYPSGAQLKRDLMAVRSLYLFCSKLNVFHCVKQFLLNQNFFTKHVS